jgi:hypothetical protein
MSLRRGETPFILSICCKRVPGTVEVLIWLMQRRARAGPKGNKPRQITDEACLILCPTSGRTLLMGFHPLFFLDCRRRPGTLIRTFGSASGEARLTIRWVIFHSGTSLFAGFTAGIQAWVSRGIPGAGLSGLHRIERNLTARPRHCVLGAQGATAATAILPLCIKSLRLKERIVNTEPVSQ